MRVSSLASLSFLVALEVFDVLVIFFARIRHDAIRRLAARERAGDRPWFSEEHGIIVSDGVFQVCLIHFLEALYEMKLGAVLVAGGVEPASFVNADRINHQRVAFPMSD